jgi:hypothetical protein
MTFPTPEQPSLYADSAVRVMPMELSVDQGHLERIHRG